MRRLLTISLLGCAAVAFAGLATPSIVSADELSDALLQAHNGLRAKHCVQPLSWSPSLAVLAQEWANHLRDDKGCQLEHSSQERRAAANAGENLAAGLPTAEATVGDWYSEVSDYDFNQPGFQSPSAASIAPRMASAWTSPNTASTPLPGTAKAEWNSRSPVAVSLPTTSSVPSASSP